jgi:NAD(P)-dependent dehydrogenase (short-subunit alcohol dehydrogenase family)
LWPDIAVGLPTELVKIVRIPIYSGRVFRREAGPRWLQPDDISPAAVFLASDAANMVTGAEYGVTGGDSAKDI